jgi:ferrous iron transport protein B
MVMGLGCNVPSVMATRMIENPKSRLVTMLIIPFMSCSARLPIYILLIGAFFPKMGSLILLGLYSLGICVALLSAKLFSKYIDMGDDLPFVMELPPYRIPSAKSVCRHTWEKGRQYLRKMGGLILAFSVIVWALGYFPSPFTPQEQGEASASPATIERRMSCLEHIGRTVAPLFAPMNFDYKMSIGILSGVGAKELVVSTLGVLYADTPVTASEENATHLQAALVHNISPASAVAYMIFVLLYLPCIATIVAIRSESGSWRWAIFSALYSTAVAYLLSWVGYVAFSS